MSPGIFTNSETGETRDAYADVADHAQQPAATEAKPAEAKPTDAGPTSTRERMVQETVSIAAMAPEDALAEYDRLREAWQKDPELADDRTPEGQAFLARLDALILRGKGLTPEENRVLLEAHGWRSREPGTQALSPAPRPVLPEGNAWDERALVLGEIEAQACGLAPHVVMQTTDELARAIEAAEARGVEWSSELGESELIRRHGREGAQRMADHARIAYETIIESEHPLLVQRVKELARDYGDDPNVVAAFAGLYQEITSAPMTPTLEALILRRTERAMQAEAAGRARAAKARQAEEAETTAASDEALDQIGAQHRRWQRRA